MKNLPGAKVIKLQDQLDKERRLVSFDSYDLTVSSLMEMIVSGAVFVPPEYQRQFIWEPKRQSTLIESVFLGIPIPSIFMAANSDATWEVVDGVQRLGSMCHFIGSKELLEKVDRLEPLEIDGLEKLSTLNRVAFADLPKSVQLYFQTRFLKVVVLNDKSDLSVRFDLFERLNTGGVTLTEQEIRNCVYRGPFNESIKSLADSPDMRKVIVLGDKAPGGAYEDVVLRFFAYLNNYQNFDHLVKNFLNEYMDKHKANPLPKHQIDLFNQTFAELAKALPNGIIRARAKSPVNLAEAIAVGTALAIKSGAALLPDKIKALLLDEELKKYTGAGSNQKKFVISRIEHVRDSVK
ncbi:MAG: DUF262 domain-containing protein [Sphingobacteriales bacterium]|nr:MAG: DUF262 domain-containing protein [Sphingobacteriales bacterium]